jgi:hypothetical protein
MNDLGLLVATAASSVMVLVLMVMGARLRRRSYTTWAGVVDEPEVGLGSYSEPFPLESVEGRKRGSRRGPGERTRRR